jgi:tRNA threonylcarbamoyladenosine biosynthesis protein TsaE
VIVRTASADETRAVGAAIASCLAPGDIVVLGGDLGSGKTTIAQGIGAGLGVTEPIVSPTFAIVREYEGRVPVAHVDVYRLDRVQELNDLGIEEILDGTRVVLVEWGELVAPVLVGDGARIAVRLRHPELASEVGRDGEEPIDDDVRIIEVTADTSPGTEAVAARLAVALEAFTTERRAG